MTRYGNGMYLVNQNQNICLVFGLLLLFANYYYYFIWISRAAANNVRVIWCGKRIYVVCKKPKKLCKFFTQYVVTRRDMHVFKIFVSWNEIMWIRAICCYLRIESSFELRLCGGTCHWVMKCLPRWICCTFRKAAWTIDKYPPVNKRTNGTPWGVHDV